MSSTRNEYILIALHRIVADLDRATERLTRSAGLTLGQFAVLEALYHKGPLTTGALKQAVLSTDGTIPVVIKNLEARGLVVRSTNPHDARQRIVDITPAGTEVIAPLYEQSRELSDDKLSVWTPTQRAELSRLLASYAPNLSSTM